MISLLPLFLVDDYFCIALFCAQARSAPAAHRGDRNAAELSFVGDAEEAADVMDLFHIDQQNRGAVARLGEGGQNEVVADFRVERLEEAAEEMKRRSGETESGMTMMQRYFLMAQTNARPMP